MFSFPLLLLEPGSNVGSAELWNRAYLGPHFTTKLRDPLVSMVYAPNLDRFPPTYLSCGHDDSFLGHTLEPDVEGALADAPARPTTVSIVEGLNHNYAKAYGNEAAQVEVERAFAWLAEKVPQPVEKLPKSCAKVMREPPPARKNASAPTDRFAKSREPVPENRVVRHQPFESRRGPGERCLQ